MSPDTICFVIILSVVIVHWIFYIIFGQKTVRKLRKNPATKELLGVEFISGWDIFNVSTALGVPRWLNRKVRGKKFAAFFADADLLEKHMTRSDLILARIHFSLWVSSALALIIFLILF